jgi:hypothetical protein
LADSLIHLKRDRGIDIVQAHAAPPSLALSHIFFEITKFEYQCPSLDEHGSTIQRGSAVRKI